MSRTPRQWPEGTGQWRPMRTLVMSHDDTPPDDDTFVVATPLDLIRLLEDQAHTIGTVVLTTPFVGLAAALRELYPRVGVIAES